MNAAHTNGEPKNKGRWACSSNNFEGPEVFVCKLAQGPRCLDKFRMQENLVTDLQRCRRKNWLVHELTKLRSYDDTTNELQ